MLEEIGVKDISPSFVSLRVPRLQIFLEMFCANSQSPVWSRHVDDALS